MFGGLNFPATKRLIAAEVYRDALREAAEQDEPTPIRYHGVYSVKDF